MRPINGRHVLFGLIAFFGVMLAANGTFVYFATTTFSGLSTEDAYRKGLQYNKTIDAYHAQQSTGWKHMAMLSGTTLRLQVQDAKGAPVSGLQIEGTLGRPATRAMDRPVALRETAPGLYEAEVGALTAGQWSFAGTGRTPADSSAKPYKMDARIWVNQ